MALAWVLVLAALWLGMAPAAQAQQITLEPSAAVQCLTPATGVRGGPDYPLVAFKDGRRGRIQVALVFTGPQQGPAVEVKGATGDTDGEFLEAVKRHVREFRVPCLPAGGPSARLLFDFEFAPDSRQVHWSTPVDAADAVGEALYGCLDHESGNKAPEYPRMPPSWSARARNVADQGRVIARLQFSAPDRPPSAQVLAPPGAEPFKAQIERWVQGYRLPCLGQGELGINIVFEFRLEGTAYGFKPDLGFVGFLRLLRAQDQHRMVFDFNTMACPFQVSFTYRTPELVNRVGEVGNSQPARRPFLDLLSTVQFDLPIETRNAVWADSTIFTVPCVRLDLSPAPAPAAPAAPAASAASAAGR